MPSRTVVYGVGALTGILLGAAIARQLGLAPGRERLQRLLGRNGNGAAAPTHIVLPDLVPAVPHEPAPEGAVVDGRGAVPTPLAPA
jgi:hypothetical protein